MAETAHEERHAEEAVDDEHEEAHLPDVEHGGDRAEERVDDHLESLEALDDAQRAQRADRAQSLEDAKALGAGGEDGDDRGSDDREVEDVPIGGEVAFLAKQPERHELERRLDHKDDGEELVGVVERNRELRVRCDGRHVEGEGERREDDDEDDEVVKVLVRQDRAQLPVEGAHVHIERERQEGGAWRVAIEGHDREIRVDLRCALGIHLEARAARVALGALLGAQRGHSAHEHAVGGDRRHVLFEQLGELRNRLLASDRWEGARHARVLRLPVLEEEAYLGGGLEGCCVVEQLAETLDHRREAQREAGDTLELVGSRLVGGRLEVLEELSHACHEARARGGGEAELLGADELLELEEHVRVRRAQGRERARKLGTQLLDLCLLLLRRHLLLGVFEVFRGRLPSPADDGDEEVDEDIVAQDEERHEVEHRERPARVRERAAIDVVPVLTRGDHEDGDEGVRKVVKVGTHGLLAELATEELHAEQGIHNDAQDEDARQIDHLVCRLDDRELEAAHLVVQAQQTQHARHTHRAQHVGFVAVDLHQEVDERAPRNKEVERVPAGLEVLATAVRHQLNEHLDRKAGGEEVVGHLDDVRELLRLALMDEAHGHRVAHDHYVDEPLPLG